MLRKLHIPAFALLVAAGAGAGITGLVHRTETARATETLGRRLAEAADRIEDRIEHISTVLVATRSFLGTRTNPDIPRDRFARYVESLVQTGVLEGVHGLGLSEIVGTGDIGALQDRLRRDYGPDRVIWPETGDPGLRTAIMLLEPADDRNIAAIGYDMYSEPVRRAAMRAAMDIGQPVMSGPVKLVQNTTPDRNTGTLIFLFMDGAERSGAPGFVYAPVRMGRLFDELSAGSADRQAIRVTDAAQPEVPLFESPDHAARTAAGAMAARHEITIAGRQWLFEGRRSEAGGLLELWPLTMLVGTASALLSVLLALAVQGVAASIRHNREFARSQQRSLQEKDLHLREMSHRLKNSLARVAAMTRQAARKADSAESFVTSMTQRLNSMAQAQDMLIRSATEGADLRQLISAELKQIYGDGDVGASLTGPDLRLNATQTQALGLTVHELATNALKYGAGANPGGQLAIDWAVERAGRGQRLRLVWAETTAAPVTAPARQGFGSQLIDSCIRLELGGTIERVFGDTGLRVTITIPFDPPGPTR
ncbi:CHASE domain-containing protein [Gemmobacter sp.]|uniref:CHASE domain-containing protein n=1 Tax=Gemmobacter sp. TaxID=1898957 RepID=UPI002AFED1FC|nr:CHASE domain-containing protein [Gemmobacter sp.]